MNQNDTSLLFDGISVYRIPDFSKRDLPVAGAKAGNILVVYDSGEQLSEEERQMLGKMLAALKLSWEDVTLIPAQSGISFRDLKRSMHFKKLIAFGFTPTSFGLNITAQNYSLLNFQDAQIVFSESLSTVNQNQNNSKNRLWKAVKQMFAE